MMTKTMAYTHNGQQLQGYFCADTAHAEPRPGVVLVHDAFGVSDYIRRRADQIAALGYAVLAADVWGDGRELHDEAEFGPMIGRFAQDRATWMGRLTAAQETLAAQPGVDAARTAIAGYCFGGASALEFVRTGGKVQGAVSLHGGLSLVGSDWSAASSGAKVLVLTGSEDPLANGDAVQALEKSLSEAGVDWEVNVYGNTKHGFTRPDANRTNRPDLVGYNAQSDARSWAAMSRFFAEIFSA